MIGFVLRRRRPRLGQRPQISARRLRQHLPRDAVESGHVHDARHHDDILYAHVLGGIAARQRRDHELGKAERQRAHPGRGDGRAAAAAQRDHRVDPPFPQQFAQDQRRRFAHRRERLPTIIPLRERREIDSRQLWQSPLGSPPVRHLRRVRLFQCRSAPLDGLRRRISSATKPCSIPLVSSVPKTAMAAMNG